MNSSELLREIQAYSIENIESLGHAAKVVFLRHIELLDLPEEFEQRRENVKSLAFSSDKESINEELRLIWDYINLAEAQKRDKDGFAGRLLIFALSDYETNVEFFHDGIEWFAHNYSKANGIKSDMESYDDFNRNQERERDQFRSGSNSERSKLKSRWWRWS